MTISNLAVTDSQKRQFEEEGYFILEQALTPGQLQTLRDTCQEFIVQADQEMEARGVEVNGINHRGNRYFLPTYERSDRLHSVLFSPVMAEVCRATLGDTAYLFLDQYVVKAPEKGMKFSWHQDSGYIPYPHRPYLTCWCPLDDMSEANGTIYILPYSRAGGKAVQNHRLDSSSNDQVGYFGDDPGIPVVVPAGSIVCFSSTLLHRSGLNTTQQWRRAWIAQYSAEPIMNEGGNGFRHYAVPFLQNGRSVRAV